MNKTFLSLLLAVLLTACASGVKLNEVPVEDKKGASVSSDSSTGAGGADSSGADSQQVPQAKSAVEPVNTMPNDNPTSGPANVEKVVYFDFDSYVVKPEFQATIEAHARFLKTNGRARISLEGHTDERGGREYNLALGQKRADAVRQSLTLLGVTESQIESVSFGKEKPAVSGNDESVYAKNRRAEFFYK